MRKVLSFLKPYKLPIFIAYTFTFIELIGEILFPFFLGMMINEGIMENDVRAVWKWGAIMTGVFLITFTCGILNSFYASHVSGRFAYDIRKKLFTMIQSFTINQLEKFSTATLVTRFTNDVRQVQNIIFMALRIMVRAPLLVIGSMTMAFIVNFKLASIFLFTVPFLTLFLLWMLNRGAKRFEFVQKSVDEVNRVIQENIAGMRMIKAFVRRDKEQEEFARANKRLAKETRTAFRFIESSMPVLLFVMNVSLLFILWFGNKQIVSGTTNVGDVVAVLNYALRIAMVISLFTFITLSFARGKASSERLEIILNEKVSSDEKLSHHLLEVTEGKIDFQHVTFMYPDATYPALEDVTFTIEPGETVAFLGETGSGKTTIFQLIPALYEPTEGVILIDDRPIESYNLETLRNSIGYVPQSPLLFTGTIKKNITFGKEDATKEEIIQAAKVAQIHDRIEQFPEKYNTIVGQKGVNLSGGQKQRISIARSLIRKPKILLLDDSTSALDLATEARLIRALEKYDCTTLIITQKITTAKRADRIILMNDGKIAAIGTHAELLETSTLYNRIVKSQLEKEIPYV